MIHGAWSAHLKMCTTPLILVAVLCHTLTFRGLICWTYVLNLDFNLCLIFHKKSIIFLIKSHITPILVSIKKPANLMAAGFFVGGE